MGEVDSAEEGNDADFVALYSAHFASLMRVAFLITGSNEAAEDVVQEAFLRCRPRLANVEHPPSYLRAAVINECRSTYRRSRRERVERAPQVGELPADLLELRDALNRLPWRQRMAIVLRYFVDIPDAEIARFLGCRPSTVRSLIRRGIANLKEALS
jgi:RNA polymerase sigma factor (sigma-70 family)